MSSKKKKDRTLLLGPDPDITTTPKNQVSTKKTQTQSIKPIAVAQVILYNIN